jgi:hypothetical protein
LVIHYRNEKRNNDGFDLSARQLCRHFGWSAQSLYDRRRRRFKEGEHYLKKEYMRGAKKHKKLLFNLEAILATFKDDISFLSSSRNKDRGNLIKTHCHELSSVSERSPRTIERLSDDEWYITYCLTNNESLPKHYIIENWRDAAIYYYKLTHEARQLVKKPFLDSDYILNQFAEQEERENSTALEYFRQYEFEDLTAIRDLCQCIENDKYNLHLKARERTLHWLNNLLEVPDLYDRIRRHSRRVKEIPKNIANLDLNTVQRQSKCFNDLKLKEQQYIVRLNRLMLEKIYPDKMPQSMDRRVLNLRRLISRLPSVLNPTIKKEPRKIIFITSRLRYLRDNVLIGRDEIAKFLKISTAQLRQIRNNWPKNRKKILHVHGKTHYAFKHELQNFFLSLDREIFLRKQVDS